ncbi:hypothetical protein [Geopsychrobacter electrodiphilus]|uniref:hypothetical protein n=1 Tax=Geopsychrobacter electrodiphilus TaxID=225196 RepID=UPI00036BF3B6|nr:hypothetical protein [Geopsychrobacter electrodiphilus]
MAYYRKEPAKPEVKILLQNKGLISVIYKERQARRQVDVTVAWPWYLAELFNMEDYYGKSELIPRFMGLFQSKADIMRTSKKKKLNSRNQESTWG